MNEEILRQEYTRIVKNLNFTNNENGLDEAVRKLISLERSLIDAPLDERLAGFWESCIAITFSLNYIRLNYVITHPKYKKYENGYYLSRAIFEHTVDSLCLEMLSGNYLSFFEEFEVINKKRFLGLSDQDKIEVAKDFKEDALNCLKEIEVHGHKAIYN